MSPLFRAVALLASFCFVAPLAGTPTDDALALLDPLIAGDVELQVRKWDRISYSDTGEIIVTGRITQEDRAGVTIRPLDAAKEQPGSSTITLPLQPRSLNILRANSAAEVYKRLRRKLGFAAENAEHQAQLGLWCLRRDVLLEDEARGHLVKALTLDPRRAGLYRPLLGLFDKKPNARKTPLECNEEVTICREGFAAGIDRLLLGHRTALLFHALGDRSAALRFLQELDSLRADELSVAPELVRQSQDLRARLLEETGLREEARKYVARVLAERDDAGAVPLWLMQGEWLFEDAAAGNRGARDELLALTEKLLVNEQTKGEALVLRGCVQMLSGDPDSATKEFAAAVLQGAVSAEQFLTYAQNYIRAGNFQKARDLLMQVQRAPKVQTDFKLTKAFLLRCEDNAQGALGLLAEAAAHPDAGWQARFAHLQAMSQLPSGRIAAAEMERYLTDFCGIPAAFAEGALLFGEQALCDNDGPLARRWLAYAASVLADDFEAQLFYGHSQLLEGGDLLEARRALANACTIESANLDVMNALGCLEYREGNLAGARRHFEDVTGGFTEEVIEEGPHPPALAYALRALAQVEAAETEEIWIDSFARSNSEQVLNNWIELERYGVGISIAGSALVFEGEQKHLDAELTVVYRTLSAERLSRFRVRTRLRQGAGDVRIALRLEKNAEGPSDGVVLFRESDGILGFSINRNGEAQVFLPLDESAEVPKSGSNGKEKDGDPSGEEYELRRLMWPDDGLEHELEFRCMRGEENTVALYFDGDCVARGIHAPMGHSDSDIRVGMSGQAALGKRYRFDVTRFEIMKTRPIIKDGERR